MRWVSLKCHLLLLIGGRTDDCSFAGLVAGTVPIFKIDHNTLTEPMDLDDNSSVSREFHSQELREDGTLQPVTIYSFHRYRARLYRIASNLNARKKCQYRLGDDAQDLPDIYSQLDQLRQALPPELCLGSYSNMNDDRKQNQADRIFRQQALTLRVLCEHIQLLLFRPFISFKRSDTSPGSEETTTTSPNGGSEDLTNLSIVSRTRCFEAASRIARIDEHPDILQLAGNTPMVTHLGVVSFTAGAVFGMLALSNPASNNARDCKIQLARVIKLPSICRSSNPLWAQATDILKDVLRLIGSEEIRSLLIGDFPRSPVSPAEEPAVASTSSVDTEGDTGPSPDRNSVQDPATLSDSGISLTNFEAFRECYTAFQDLYGPSIGLGNSAQSMAMVQNGKQ